MELVGALLGIFALILVLATMVSISRTAAETKKIRELLERHLRDRGEP